ncbi:arylsulfatase [Sphingomonas sp. DBB INV C78]
MGAPNVLLIMTDDVGFGASSAFGGPIPTPTFDALAKQGLRYNQFNTTALCSPTRAALLTGRNPHNVGMGNVTNLPTGYDGYTSVIPKSAATTAEVLKQNGYNTAMFGKSHLTPEWEMSQAGPFDRWPNGLGFEYFYGFLSADASMWSPNLVENSRPVEPPHNDPSYHFDRDMADHAIRWIEEQHALAPDKPFFVYYAPGTAHTPHHAPKEWLDRFRGKFDQGWDAIREETYLRQKRMGIIPPTTQLTPRPASLPAWNSLSADQKRLYSRLMEAYAASLAYADEQMGRIVADLKAKGEFDNTLIIFIQGDNGGSGEGGLNGLLFEQSGIARYDEDFNYMLSRIDEIGSPTLYNHYPAAWGWALNAPFQWTKQVASHFGGIRNGLVVSWPARIKDAGGVRDQFHYVTDVMPTILEAAGVKAPSMVNGVAQQPIDGVSMAYSFTQKAEPSHRKTQVFEMMENMGIYQDGWWAGTTPARSAWDVTKNIKIDLDTRKWELYNIRQDFSQAKNLAASNPAKLQEMQQLFWAEAARSKILPIHDFAEGTEGRPTLTEGRDQFVYYPGLTRAAESAVPHTIGHSYAITADVVLPDRPANGVLVTQGGRFGGYALYLKNGRPIFHYNAVGPRQYKISATEALPPGPHKILADFKADSAARGGGGTLTLSVDGKIIGSGRVEHTLFGWVSHTEGFDVGEDTITPINDDYTIPASRFDGDLRKIIFDVK